jgi:hypothetical protein
MHPHRFLQADANRLCSMNIRPLNQQYLSETEAVA